MVNEEFVAWAQAYRGHRFHAGFCDGPYGLEFLQAKWDSPSKYFPRESEKHVGGLKRVDNLPRFVRTNSQAYQAQVTIWGKAMLLLFLPGALIFMFGGTRTWHRLAAGMEDAGFELWDTVMFFLYRI